MIVERRVKEKCICSGEVFRWKSDGKLRKACIVCGTEIEAKRDSDREEFHEDEAEWH